MQSPLVNEHVTMVTTDEASADQGHSGCALVTLASTDRHQETSMAVPCRKSSILYTKLVSVSLESSGVQMTSGLPEPAPLSTRPAVSLPDIHHLTAPEPVGPVTPVWALDELFSVTLRCRMLISTMSEISYLTN